MNNPFPHALFIPQAADWINANDRGHWAKRAQLTRAWRHAAGFTARRHKIPRFESAHIIATIHKATGRGYDASNLQPTLKAIVDGLVDAGVLDDDDNSRLIGPDARMGEKIPVNPGVMLTITPMGQGDGTESPAAA